MAEINLNPITKRCSVCNKVATKEIQVIQDDGEHFIPRCDKHIVKDYEGIIKKIKNEK